MSAASTSPTARQDEKIVRVAIHPAIGIARVGDSPSDFFLGPETTEPPEDPPGGWRDATGALKRQAARFRIYGYDAAGRVVREVTSAEAAITWTVHVANRKAAWYKFATALDIEGAAQTTRRNEDWTDRARLVIDPGPRTVTGAGATAAFDTGTFVGKRVDLGEMRTDEQGRLLVLGGHGVSDSYNGTPPETFADNDGWHDDTSDGPVDATVTFRDGTRMDAVGAWVVVAPPNYAPRLVGFQTMFDVIENTFTPEPLDEVSFTRDVHPPLRQLTDLQWVNAGIAQGWGWKSAYDFSDPARIRKLADRTRASAPAREAIFAQFRDPRATESDPSKWPPYYGDHMDEDFKNPDSLLAVTPLIHARLSRWAQGDFINDWTGKPGPNSLDQVPVEQQPAMLDKAALWWCLGGPFHPGCELTWPMRLRTLYAVQDPEHTYERFRIKRRAPDAPEPDYGPALQPLEPGQDPPPGTPYHEQGPGDLTRWMAVPWQTDTASCRSGYNPDYNKYLPTFWAARVPNTVLSEDAYRTVMDTSLDLNVRIAAFNTRMDWNATLPGFVAGDYKTQIKAMITLFPRMGLVTPQPGPEPFAFPDVIHVSDGKPAPAPQVPARPKAVAIRGVEALAEAPSTTPLHHAPLLVESAGRVEGAHQGEAARTVPLRGPPRNPRVLNHLAPRKPRSP